jgi:glycosyltransferase involved in cell wall biosynthesis
MALRNLLLVTYQFPPVGGSGVQRALKLASYLPRSGWRAHVVSAGHVHYPLLDPTLTSGVDGEVAVHRTCGLEPAGVAQVICRHLAPAGSASDWLGGVEDRLYWRLDRMFGRLQLPETEMLWVPAAIRQARRLVDRHEIEAVVTTSPPNSAHLVGLSLRRRLGLPWVADMRDPILDNFAQTAQGRLADRFWRWLEGSVVRHADAVVVTCPELADRLTERYPDVAAGRFCTITNGFDPADGPGFVRERIHALNNRARMWSANPGPTSPKRERGLSQPVVSQNPSLALRAGRALGSDSCRTIAHGDLAADAPAVREGIHAPAAARGRFTLAYVGAFYREQTIGPILEAIRRLRAARTDVARDLAFRLIGSLSSSQRRLLQEGDDAFFHDVGYRPHEEAVAEMSRADVLLLVTPANDGGRLCIPAKMFEYLAFGGHIIAQIHAGTAMWRILAAAGNVTLLDHRAPGALTRAFEKTQALALCHSIERCYDAWRAGTLDGPRDRSVVDRFRRDRLAGRYAKLVERCVERAVGLGPRGHQEGSPGPWATPGDGLRAASDDGATEEEAA